MCQTMRTTAPTDCQVYISYLRYSLCVCTRLMAYRSTRVPRCLYIFLLSVRVSATFDKRTLATTNKHVLRCSLKARSGADSTSCAA
jgi:hypothetical protein